MSVEHRTPIPRTIKQIVDDIEGQAARCPHNPALMLHSELRRLVAAGRDQHPDALAFASALPEPK